jgi:ankyrin repeat protein
MYVVDFFLTIPGVDINATDGRKRTPLMMAVLSEDEEMVGRLLDHPEIQPNISEDFGWRLRPRSPVDYRGLDLKRGSGETALSHAVAQGSELLVDLFIRHARVDLDSRDIRGRTPLMIAIIQAHESAVEQLLQPPRVDVSVYESVVRQLLESPSIDVNASDNFDNTALLYAAAVGLEGIVALLLDKEDTDIDAVNEADDTALHLAARNGHKGVIKLLLRKGCGVSRPNIQGFTPAALALQNGHDAAARLLSPHPKPSESP